jgi:hypothetical protein
LSTKEPVGGLWFRKWSITNVRAAQNGETGTGQIAERRAAGLLLVQTWSIAMIEA